MEQHGGETSTGAGATGEHGTEGVTRQRGSCHCGSVRFEVDVDLRSPATRCNCSASTKIGPLTGIVQPDAFTLLQGEDALATYEWGGKVIQRRFCTRCGVHCFGYGKLPELGGDFVSINYNCLDGVELTTLKVIYWDGRHDNWQAGPRDVPWPIAPTA